MPDESVGCCVSLCVCGFRCCSHLQIDTDRCPGTLAVFPVHSELAVLVSPICPRLHQGNSTVTRVTFWSFHDTEFNILFTILLFSNPSCGCC